MSRVYGPRCSQRSELLVEANGRVPKEALRSNHPTEQRHSRGDHPVPQIGAAEAAHRNAGRDFRNHRPMQGGRVACSRLCVSMCGGVAEVVATRGPQLIVDTTPLDDESPREMPAAVWFIVSSRISLR